MHDIIFHQLIQGQSSIVVLGLLSEVVLENIMAKQCTPLTTLL